MSYLIWLLDLPYPPVDESKPRNRAARSPWLLTLFRSARSNA